MPLSDHNGDSSFTIGGKTYTNQSSSGVPIYKITSTDGGDALGDGWMDNAYWTRGIKISSSSSATGYQWIHNNVGSFILTAKPMTDHHWYDSKGKLVSNFSVPSSYYLRYKSATLWDWDASANTSLAGLIADGRQNNDSIVQTENAWWANGYWTVKNNYHKVNLASERMDTGTSPSVGSIRGPGYNNGGPTTLSFIYSISNNTLRGYTEDPMYLIPA